MWFKGVFSFLQILLNPCTNQAISDSMFLFNLTY